MVVGITGRASQLSTSTEDMEIPSGLPGHNNVCRSGANGSDRE